MKIPSPPTHIWPTVLAAAIAAFVALAADQARAAESPHLDESQIIQQIQRYCTASWRNANLPQAEWSDCSQQVFAELLQRVSRKRLAKAIFDPNSPERRELNRAIWRIAQRWLRAIRFVSLSGSDCPDPATIGSSHAQLDVFERVMQIAAERLSPRQSRILSLLCDGQSIGQISQQLSIPPERVSDEKYRAIQKIRRYVSTSS